jgi:hypothetical protein
LVELKRIEMIWYKKKNNKIVNLNSVFVENYIKISEKLKKTIKILIDRENKIINIKNTGLTFSDNIVIFNILKKLKKNIMIVNKLKLISN